MPITKPPPFFNMQYTGKDGNLTSNAHLYNDQMYQTLNNLQSMFNKYTTTIFKDDAGLTTAGIKSPALIGLNVPSFTTTQITAILAYNPPPPLTPVPIGTIWFNSTLNKLQFKGSSGVQTITST